MSSYHSYFEYLGKKSTEENWIISHFDPDNGEMDGFLSQDQVYSDSYNGTKRKLYGTKYNSVAVVKITVIKSDGSDFSLDDCRRAYKWLTGKPEASWMNLYVGDKIKYRLLCTIQDVKPQKMDARTIGLNIYCESLSPWAYSTLEVKTHSLKDGKSFIVDCPSDDMYVPVCVKTTYTNGVSTSVKIHNTSSNDGPTEISGLVANEVIILDNNMFIKSDKPSKVFGNTFNFIWPKLFAGSNEFVFEGDGVITFEYYYPIKMGDCAITLNAVSDIICNENGDIQIDMLDWSRITGTPNTLSGYGIINAYTKTEIDKKLENIDASVVDTYTKAEIDEKINNITASNVDIDESALNTMLSEVLA